jgi:hypothetical protein
LHDARVNLAHFLQREEIGGMFRVMELIAGRLVDRHGDRAIGRIGAPTRMQRQCFRMFGFDGHVGFSFGWMRWISLAGRGGRIKAHCDRAEGRNHGAGASSFFSQASA